MRLSRLLSPLWALYPALRVRHLSPIRSINSPLQRVGLVPSLYHRRKLLEQRVRPRGLVEGHRHGPTRVKEDCVARVDRTEPPGVWKEVGLAGEIATTHTAIQREHARVLDGTSPTDTFPAPPTTKP